MQDSQDGLPKVGCGRHVEPITYAPDPALGPVTRERLLHLLAEASELEHNLLCSYLFALFSLKQRPDEGVTEQELAAIRRWRRALMSVCVEEMVHLTQVANITAALGARPHLDRPNLPVAPGYHPSDIAIALTPFGVETLKHFIFLERPDCAALDDSASVKALQPGRPGDAPPPTRLTPSAPEYATIGEFYSILRDSLGAFVRANGEAQAFSDDAFQLDGKLIDAPSLVRIRSLEDAHRAIDRIIEQGEGAPDHHEQSHFARFSSMLKELEELQQIRPGFQPARRVGANPVLRAPQAAERTVISAGPARSLADVLHAVYWQMLRTLSVLYDNPGPCSMEPLVRHLLDCMHLLAELAAGLTQLPAADDAPGVMAGPSFTIFRHSEGSTTPAAGVQHLIERCSDIDTALRALATGAELRERACKKVQAMRSSLAAALPGHP